MQALWDTNDYVRAEVCFGQADITLTCMPNKPADTRGKRFSVGQRVACAVEDATGSFSDWAAGTVTAVNYVVPEWPSDVAAVPYQVRLDTDTNVLVHRDDHSLVRELSLQPEGSRQAADGSRCMSRMTKRELPDGMLQMIDQQYKHFHQHLKLQTNHN